MKFISLTSILLLSSLTVANAATIFDESTSGDLSTTSTAPTQLTNLILGSNVVIGSLTNSPQDRDFLTFTVPTGFVLSQIVLDVYDTTEDVSFFAYEDSAAISDITSTDGFVAFGLFGDVHVGTNVLDNLTGSTDPLPAGDYTFWFQETAANVDYQWDYQLATVPEPSTGLLVLIAGAGLMRRRRR